MQLSIIVPIGPDEGSWSNLLLDLAPFLGDQNIEIIFSGVTHRPQGLNRKVRWIKCKVPSRAKQLNAGARKALGPIYLFLHADSRLGAKAIQKTRALTKNPKAITQLGFFDLHFVDGPRWMRLNEWGVLFRSRVLGLPFGDQGFLISAANFKHLGGFCETAPYGEDHLFVWKAHRTGIKVRSLSESIATSARKYTERGWLGTTAKHLFYTAAQALPEVVALLKEKAREKI